MPMIPKSLERRKVLALTGTAAAAIAGCGEDSANTDTSGENSSNGMTYDLHTRSANPSDLQWSPYYVQRELSFKGDKLLFENIAWNGGYPKGVDGSDYPEYIPGLAKDWELDEGKLVVTIPKDRVWHNGDQVRPNDLKRHFTIQKHMNEKISNVVESVETGSEEVVFNLTSNKINPQIVKSSLFDGNSGTLIKAKPDGVYKDFAERIMDATTEQEIDQIKEDLIQEKVDTAIGTGPWQLEKVTNSSLQLTKFEDHPNAANIEFDRIKLHSYPNNQKRQLALEKGLLDALVQTSPPKSIQEEFPDELEKITYPGYFGAALMFNFTRGPTSNRNIRRAIAYLINREKNATNAQTFITIPKYPSGLTNRLVDQWLGEDNPLDTYGWNETLTEEAFSLLRKEGYQHEDGTWINENDEPLEVNILTAGSGTWNYNAQTANTTLNDAGIKSQTVIKDKAGFGEARQSGDFQMSMTSWHSGKFPYKGFSWQFTEPVSARQNIDATKLAVPYPIGNPEGELKEVNVGEKVSELAVSEGEKRAELVRELAWIYNQTIPRIPLALIDRMRFVNSKEWKYPEKDSKWMKYNPIIHLANTGHVRPS